MATKLRNPLTITSGLGVNVNNSGVEFDASSPITQIIDVGNDVSITGNVQFNQLTASLYSFGNDISITNSGHFLGNPTYTGPTSITTTLSIGGNSTITGNIVAKKIVAELTSSSAIFDSGSTIFGDTIDDTHHMTGSINQSGSFILNGYSVDEITNDTALSGGSSTSIVTENTAKSYADSNVGASTVEPYLRKNYNKVATSILNNTASFTAVTASAPSGVTATSETDFLFFNNGQIMEHDAITIQQAGSTFLLKVDSNSVGYNLESNDEIKAWGKFNA